MNITIRATYDSALVTVPLLETLTQRFGDKVHVDVITNSHNTTGHLPARRKRARALILGGAALGMLVGALSSLVFPIVDQSPASSVLIAASLGAVTGVLLGYFTGGLILASLATSEVQDVTKALDHGKVVVQVETEPDEAAQVIEVLVQTGSFRSDGLPGVERSDEVDIGRALA